MSRLIVLVPIPNVQLNGAPVPYVSIGPSHFKHQITLYDQFTLYVFLASVVCACRDSQRART